MGTDPKYGPVGAPIRRHGRCTCRNNSAWPHCSLCQDWCRCDGCKYCDPEYALDLNDETPKGLPHCSRLDCSICNNGKFCGRERDPNWYNK